MCNISVLFKKRIFTFQCFCLYFLDFPNKRIHQPTLPTTSSVQKRLWSSSFVTPFRPGATQEQNLSCVPSWWIKNPPRAGIKQRKPVDFSRPDNTTLETWFITALGNIVKSYKNLPSTLPATLRDISQQNDKSVIIYSPSCHYKPARNWFIFGRQIKIFSIKSEMFPPTLESLFTQNSDTQNVRKNKSIQFEVLPSLLKINIYLRLLFTFIGKQCFFMVRKTLCLLETREQTNEIRSRATRKFELVYVPQSMLVSE